MKLHMDGARLANAAASLDLPLRAFTRDAGVDVLSFGGTKNGALVGEAIVVLNPAASEGLIYLRKLNMQLASKMRFVSAQLIALLEGDLWLRNAAPRQRHGPAPARRARGRHRRRASSAALGFTQPTQANGVFATLPRRRRRPAARVVPVLRLGCREERGALDVLVRHDRGRHRRLRRGDPRELARAYAACPGA